jgi:hypothetical protein
MNFVIGSRWTRCCCFFPFCGHIFSCLSFIKVIANNRTQTVCAIHQLFVQGLVMSTLDSISKFEPCAQVEKCPWRDSNGNVDVRVFARDHSIGAGADAGSPAGLPAADGGIDTNQTYEPVATASSFGCNGGAIAHGEVFNYTVSVSFPAPGRQLTATMAWTDPAGTIDDTGSLVGPFLDLFDSRDLKTSSTVIMISGK